MKKNREIFIKTPDKTDLYNCHNFLDYDYGDYQSDGNYLGMSTKKLGILKR